MTTPPPERPVSPSSPPPPADRGRRFELRGRTLAVIAALAAVSAVAIAALLTTIIERRGEARQPFIRVAEVTDTTIDPSVWGLNFPHQYDTYIRTVDQVRTRYGGSEALPHRPTDVDPRSVLAQSRLEEDPRLREFWAGYPFAEDFREERGHAYMLSDQIFTRRQIVAQQPGACLNCHASMYVAYRRAGDGDLVRGFERINVMPFQEAVQLVNHPISCIDCHDPGNMQLRITRPAFMEGMRSWMASRGVQNYDVNRQASRQEMRTFICAQCHVEYYFQGPERRLTFPWAKGLLADSMLAYYDSTGHRDWTHARSGARVLKAQHPEFEMFMQGTHARAGVACADCHMPYERVGAMKISSHHVRSPILSIARSCQPCHRASEAELEQRVYNIQDRTYEVRNLAIDAVLQLVREIEAAAQRDSNDPRLVRARDFHYRAQFMADFVEAENSMGFHAPQEAVRVAARAIDYARLGMMALHGRPLPDDPRGAARGPAGPSLREPAVPGQQP
jgi:nitrite reductase (cytochrome c-552)